MVKMAKEQCDMVCDKCDARESCADHMDHLKGIRKKILVGSGKGGVGKSTVAVYLALMLSRHGYRVGILDADITGPDVPKLLGIEEDRLTVGPKGIRPAVVDGIKVVSMALIFPASNTAVAWRGPLKMAAIKQFLTEVDWGELDYLIVDLPPGTSDEPISLAQLIPDLSGVVVVTTPQEVSILDVTKFIDLFRKMNVPIIGLIENMSGLVCPHCGKRIDAFGAGRGEIAARDMELNFLGSIPLDTELSRFDVGDVGDSPALRSLDAIATRIEKMLESDESKGLLQR